MPKDTRTAKKTRLSSLCEKMSFTVPTSWGELKPEQLRYVIRLLWLYGEAPDWQERVKTAAFLHFCDIEVVSRTDQGWLCREQETGRTFLLDPSLLPSLLQHLEWICQTEQMTVRIGQVGEYKAFDFELMEMPFGLYLEAEGSYQSYLAGKQQSALFQLAKSLYRVPEDENPEELKDEVLLGAFLWFTAVKQLLGEEFPNFLKPAGDKPEPITRESIIEGRRAQLRLLTKGDVTKEQYIKDKVDTWTALAELDALAKEAEEIKRKYGK